MISLVNIIKEKPLKRFAFQGLFFLTLIVGLSSFCVKHAFHTSVTELQYNAKTKSLEISVRVFTDDLQTALTKENGNKKVVLEKNDAFDALVQRYISKRFVLISPLKQRRAYTYVGKEQEKDATWIYLEMPIKESLKGTSILNEVLMETFDDQTNIVNIIYPQEKKSLLFNNRNRRLVVE